MAGVTTTGITKPILAIANQSNYPTSPLTNEELEAFNTIAERIIPMPEKVAAVSSSTMDRFRNLYSKYEIETNGEFANGMNPLYYWRSFEYNTSSRSAILGRTIS